MKVGQARNRAAVAVKKEGIGRDNCNLLSKEYIAVNFSSTKGSQHLFSFIHKCVAHSFPYMSRSSQYATKNMYMCRHVTNLIFSVSFLTTKLSKFGLSETYTKFEKIFL